MANLHIEHNPKAFTYDANTNKVLGRLNENYSRRNNLNDIFSLHPEIEFLKLAKVTKSPKNCQAEHS